jgi:hypothetical protein
MSDHIKIAAKLPRCRYRANGVQRVFTFDFAVFRPEDVEIRIDGSPISAGYSVAVGAPGTGAATLDAAPTDGAIVTLSRRLVVRRETDFQEGGELRAKTLNDELDFQTAALQQVETAAARALHLPVDDPDDAITQIPRAALRASRALVFDAAGNPAVSVDVYADQAAASAASAAAAAGSAVSAATASGNASNAAVAAATSSASAASAAASATAQATSASASAATAAASVIAASGSAASAAASAAGLSALAIAWNFESATAMAAPAAGSLRFNAATLAGVSALALSASAADPGNPDISDIVAAWNASTSTSARGQLVLRKRGAPSTFAAFKVSGVTDNGTWLLANVVPVASAGTWSAGDVAYAVFTAAGDKGDTGSLAGGGSLTASLEEARRASVASAATTNVWGGDGNFVHITGTATVSSFGTAPQAGSERTLVFDGALTLVHSFPALQLPGNANIVTAPGDRAIVRADTPASHIVVAYTRADGTPLALGNAGPVQTILAGESIADRDLVYQDIFNQRGGGSTRWYRVDADATGPVRVSPVIGIALGALAAGGTGSAQIRAGRVAGFAGLVPGNPVWASATPGGVTQSPPALPASGTQHALRLIGIAASAAEIDFAPDDDTLFVKTGDAVAHGGVLTVEHWSDAGAPDRVPYASAIAQVFATTVSRGAGTNGTGYNGYTARLKFAASVLSTSGSRVRVTFKAGITQPLCVNNAYIGEAAASGNAWDFAASPVRLTFNGGASGFTTPAGTNMVSDGIAFALDEAKSYIVALEVAVAGGPFGTDYTSPPAGWSTYYKTGGVADAGAVAPGGYSQDFANTFLVTAIEVLVATRREPEPVFSEARFAGATDKVTCRYDDGAGGNADTRTSFVNRTGTLQALAVEVQL